MNEQLRGDHAELSRLARSAGSGEGTADLADAHERIRVAEQRMTEIENATGTLRGELVNEAEVTEALAEFGSVWDALAPREQIRILELLIERIEFDGHRGTMSITFRPTGINALTDELASLQEDAA